MILLRSAIVMLIFGEISECFRFEPMDFREFQSYDSPRNYPMFKIAYYDPLNTKSVKKGEVRANIILPGGRSANLKSEDSSEHVDNVRAFEPRSREDIKGMKKLSFHGRSSPNAQQSSPENKSSSSSVSGTPPVQLNFQDRKYIGQQANDARKSASSEEISSERFSLKEYDGFMPLMRPSPISVHPVEPEKFMTVRNYVNLLKSRQKDFFADVIEPKKEQGQEQGATTEKQLSEVDYFIKRERELVDEQQPPKEHRNLEHVEVVEPIVKEQEHENVQNDEEESRRHDRIVPHDREESRQHDSFVPFRLYAQVRHVESEKHKPKPRASGPRPKEKLSLEKKNIYYKEEGYLEKDYDHGAEEVASKYRYRGKRDVRDMQGSPVAMAYNKKSTLPQLTGENLLKHLDELIKNSSIYLPDDNDDVVSKKAPSDNIYGGQRNLKSHKYPYYNLPDSKTLNTMSAFRYSENIKNFPRAKQSLYSFKNLEDCQQIDQEEIDPVPKDADDEDPRTRYNKSPQRLKNLGDKIGCYKEKVFGKDPFDNPLFKEKYVVPSVPIPLQDTSILSHQANPLITVYDDVISNIRAAFAEELKLKQEKLKQEELKQKEKDALTSSSSQHTKKVKPDVEITSLSSAPSTSRLPIFDINNYYPKLKIPLNDETLIPPVIKENDYEMEIIDIPINRPSNTNSNLLNTPQGATALVIKNLRPPNLTQENRRRRNPITYKVTRSITLIPSTLQQYFQAPAKKFNLL